MPQRKNKGLGRGLDALFTEFDETATADETVVELNLSDIRSNPYQPRKTFDETSLSELSDSIRKQGVFQPIIVRQSKVSGYEIIAGERRYRASKMAKRTTIPAIVRDLNEEEMRTILSIADEMIRKTTVPCTACHYCVSHCPMGLDIPFLLKMYNEAMVAGAGDFIAPMGLASVASDKQPECCIGCHSCEQVCPKSARRQSTSRTSLPSSLRN